MAAAFFIAMLVCTIFPRLFCFRSLGGPFRQVGGALSRLSPALLRSQSSELYAQCQLSIFLTVVQNSVINSYRSLYSLPGSTSTFLLLLLSASTLIVKTFEDGDGDSLKVNEKCVKNDDTKKNNNTVVKLKLLQYVVSEIAKSSLKVLVSNKDTNNVRAPKKVSSSLLAARCRSTTRARRR